MKAEKFLYIIRHGETDFNRMNIVQGKGVDTDLNETGRMQAEKFYSAYRDLPFDKIYTSGLKRTQQSVQRFINDGIPHQVLHELNEISWGDFEGKPQSEEERNIYWEIVNRWNTGDHHARVANGESPFEVQQRQKIAMAHIIKDPHDKNILVCMHGRAMKSLMCLLLDQPLSKMEDYRHTNLCLYVVRYAEGRYELITHCDVRHLGE